MSCKELKRQMTKLEKEYNKQYYKDLEMKRLQFEADEEARAERLKTKVIKLNANGKPITTRKKICQYNCEHCNIICSSDESDEDYPIQLQAYKSSKPQG